MARKANVAQRSGFRNALSIGGLTFVVSLFFSGPAQHTLQKVDILFGITILAGILGVALVADILAVAAAAAEEAPFHAMASHRIGGAREAVYIVRRKERVNSLFADVIGDICGTVSGAIAAPIILELHAIFPTVPISILSMLVIGLIASVTVGGKAWTKGFALRNATAIVGTVGKGWYWIKRLMPRRPRPKRAN